MRAGRSPATFLLGEIEVDLDAGRLRRGAVEVHLQPRAWRLLALLVSDPNRLFSRDELARELWPDTHVTEDSLTQQIRRLRQVFGPAIVATLPRRGYRLGLTPLARDGDDEGRTIAAAPPLGPTGAWVGRGAERLALRSELAGGGALSLWGPAGVGKTALAATVARDLPDVVWVDLGGARDRSVVESRLAAALDLGSPGALPARAPARPGEVWVLDGADPVVAEVVAELRPLAPALGWLAVGRAPVGPPLRPFPLGPLPVGGGDWRDSDAGRLLIARLRELGADPDPRDLGPQLVATGGLPLAVQLLAARVAGRRPGELASDGDPLEQLCRTALAELGPEGEELFFAGAAFAGMATAEAIAAVAGPGPAAHLDALVRSGLASVDRGRYGLVPALRAVAARLSASDPRAGTWRRRHAAHYAQYGQPSLAMSADVHGSERLRNALALDLDELALGLETSLDGGDAETAALCFLGACLVWSSRGPIGLASAAGRRVHELALAPRTRARVDLNLTELLRAANRLEDSRRYAEEGRQLAALLGDRHLHALLGLAYGVTLLRLGAHDRARAVYLEALGDFEAAGDQRSVGVALTNLGALADERGDLVEAEARARAAIAVHRQVRNLRLLGITLANLGQMFLERGALGEAEAACAEALEHLRLAGFLREEARALGVLSDVRQAQGDLAGAIALSREALRVAQRVGDARAERYERQVLDDLLRALADRDRGADGDEPVD